MYKFENTVAVVRGTTYEGGTGYEGPILRSLGFPRGPWTPLVARIFVRQAKTVDASVKFDLVTYRR